jgi:hypothetical protein
MKSNNKAVHWKMNKFGKKRSRSMRKKLVQYKNISPLRKGHPSDERIGPIRKKLIQVKKNWVYINQISENGGSTSNKPVQ